jgi:hypothetical protein
MLTFFAIWGCLTGTVGLIMAFARTGPDDAASNLSKWLERAGIHQIPNWLRARQADKLVYRWAMLVMAALLFVGGIGFDSWIRGLSIPSVSRASGDFPVLQRRLSDDRKNRLAREFAQLKPQLSKASVSFPNGDGEADVYMHDFADAFRRAGIEPLFTWTTPDGPDQVGVFVAVSDISSPPSLAAKLQDALKSVGIEADIIPFPKAGILGASDPRPLALYVAPRPL